jgi:hypothetical protein
MSFGEGIFWQAFKAAGMLFEAEYVPPAGPPVPFDVGYTRPDQIVLDGAAHTTDYTIEYQAADVTLARHSVVRVDGMTFKVAEPPRARGTGEFFIAILERANP